jgi:hypothetical protein
VTLLILEDVSELPSNGIPLSFQVERIILTIIIFLTQLHLRSRWLIRVSRKKEQPITILEKIA